MKLNRKKEWLHLVLGILVTALVWAYKDFVATVLSIFLTVAVALWAIAMWQALTKAIPVKEVSLEETFKGWWITFKTWFAELMKKTPKKVEPPVEEYEEAEDDAVATPEKDCDENESDEAGEEEDVPHKEGAEI